MKHLLTFSSILIGINLWAQVGIGTSSPDPKAILDLNSTTRGLLVPRLTDVQVNDLGNDLPEGLIIYDKVNKKFLGWDGSVWQNLGYEEQNTPPYYTMIDFTGNLNVDENLSSSLGSYIDNQSDPESTPLYYWKSADDNAGTNLMPIGNADSYTLTSNELNKFIQLCIRANASSGASPGVEQCSAFQGPVNDLLGNDLPYVESFESTSNYTTSVPENIANTTDYFSRTDGSTIAASFSGSFDGNYFFAAQDIDGATSGSSQYIDISGISITGASNLQLEVLIAEDDDGTNEDWDSSDYVHFEYRIDGGSYLPLLWIENDGTTFNGAPLIDTDFDGIGDGTLITDTWTNLSASISGTGNSLDIRIVFNLDSGDEDIAIDHIRITAN